MIQLEILIIPVLASVSAFLSAAEIALFSLSRFQIKALKERSPGLHSQIKRLLADPAGVLITILILNECVNIALAALIAENVAAAHYQLGFWPFSSMPPWAAQSLLGTLITTPIVLLICEITPKAIAARANQLVAPMTTGPLTWAYQILLPFRWALSGVVRLVHRALGRKAKEGEAEGKNLLREEEFLVMIEEGHKEGAIHSNEMELIRNVFELDNTQVSEIYTPLSKVVTVTLSSNIQQVTQRLKKETFSRIPVLAAQGKKEVIGILFKKDILLAQHQNEPIDSVSELMRKPLLVPRTMRLNTLFRRLKQYQTHIAVVINARGEAIGIVTMTDVLEALFEDLFEDLE